MNSKSGVLESTYSVKITRIETKIADSGDRLIVRAIRKRNQLFKISLDIDRNMDCVKLINTLEMSLNAMQISKIQWAKNDLLFQQFIDLSLFRNAYDVAPRKVQINLYSPIKIIKDHDEQQLAISKAHCDSNYHFGLRKTLARLQSGFYWKKMTKDVSKYIAGCGHCIDQKNSMWKI